MRITHSAGFNLPFPPISHSPGVLEPSSVTDNVSKLNFLMKEPENTFKDSINIQLKNPTARLLSFICRIGRHNVTASFLLSGWKEVKSLCDCEEAKAGGAHGEIKKVAGKKAFCFLKLQPMSTTTAGGQPPARWPLQHYTLLLKSPDTAQWASHLPCYTESSL